jgi:hypothetical protein
LDTGKTKWPDNEYAKQKKLKIYNTEELMGGQVGSAPACYSSSLDSNPDISKK